ncbi:MAG TPA: PadR family transcriptional regulator [Solirubrobacterales bacterium]|nr:PadR family transcriptional regulator [Solirubrobacterales bacterium]
MHAEQAPGDLPATAYAVLGLLSFGDELTGYDLRQRALNLRFFYWSPAQSHIYAELRRLRAHEFVAERLEPQSGRPDKRLYRITGQGLQAFRTWLDEAPVEPPLLKHAAALRLFFGHQASPGRVRQVLEEHRRRTEQLLAELRQVHERIAEVPAFAYPSLVAEWGEHYYGAELEAVRRMLDRLTEHEGREDGEGDPPTA